MSDNGPHGLKWEDSENLDMMTPGEVARLFRVDPKTVTRWAGSGKLTRIKTPGGHNRLLRAEVMQLLGEVIGPERE